MAYVVFNKALIRGVMAVSFGIWWLSGTDESVFDGLGVGIGSNGPVGP